MHPDCIGGLLPPERRHDLRKDGETECGGQPTWRRLVPIRKQLGCIELRHLQVQKDKQANADDNAEREAQGFLFVHVVWFQVRLGAARCTGKVEAVRDDGAIAYRG